MKWIKGMPILVTFHSDDFRWCGPPDLIEEWNILVAAFEASKYKVKDCTKELFVGINVTTDEKGNYYLDQKKAVEGVVKVAKLTGASYHIHWRASHCRRKTTLRIQQRLERQTRHRTEH